MGALPKRQLHARFVAEVERQKSLPLVREVVTEGELEHLPAPLSRYLRWAGVVGEPKVKRLHAVMHGRIRNAEGARWMEFHAEQHSLFEPLERAFFIEARRFGLPFVGLHLFKHGEATMEGRLAGLLPVIDEKGPVMSRAETVTVFNDLCVFAPSALLDANVEWRTVNARVLDGRFTHCGQTVEARLFFDESGMLSNFESRDRALIQGGQMRPQRWSTPLHGARRFGNVRLVDQGEARWGEPGEEWSYIELSVDSLETWP